VAEYVIYFNQQWVGDHPDEWFRERGRLAMAVVDEMKAAGVHVFAGGLEEDHEAAFCADPDGTISPGPHVRTGDTCARDSCARPRNCQRTVSNRCCSRSRCSPTDSLRFKCRCRRQLTGGSTGQTARQS